MILVSPSTVVSCYWFCNGLTQRTSGISRVRHEIAPAEPFGGAHVLAFAKAQADPADRPEADAGKPSATFAILTAWHAAISPWMTWTTTDWHHYPAMIRAYGAHC